MTEYNTDAVFDAVANDNLALFEELCREKLGNLSLCFGRFPVLSLCYLYGSSKILRAYESELYAVRNYRIAPEPPDAYLKFKERAGKSLRLYLAQGATVHPYEMLAVLGQSSELKRAHFLYAKEDESVKERVLTVYRLTHNLTAAFQGTEFIYEIPKSNGRELLLIVIAALLLAVMLTVAVLYFIIGLDYFGDGTVDKPYKIYRAEQLSTAIKADAKFVTLMNDIAIPADWESLDFAGNIQGNGHTLSAAQLKNPIFKQFSGSLLGVTLTFGTLQTDAVRTLTKGEGEDAEEITLSPAYFADEISGTLQGVRFEFGTRTEEISKNTAYVTGRNTGVIKECTLTGDFILAEHGSEEKVYLSLFVYENVGQISDCSYEGGVELSGDGTGDVYFSTFTNFNGGTLYRCVVKKGAVLVGQHVDLSGIVTENEAKGTVKSCENHAAVTQTATLDTWSPIVAGIALFNYGEVTASINSGAIEASLAAESGNRDLYVAGIVARNESRITKSKNTGNITAKGKVSYPYIGGIAALNSSSESAVAEITDSGSIGVLTTECDEERYSFMGGITGLNSGTVRRSFSACSFVFLGAGTPFFGGIIGVTDYYNTQVNGNYYLHRENITYAIATVLLSNTLYLGINDGALVAETWEALTKAEVYWE